MLRTSAGLISALMVLTTPVVAGHCPMDAAAIDAALQKLTVSDEVKTQVTALRDEGMELHEAGDHAASEAKLAEAMRTLLNEAE
jgi:hypothetical protein